MDKLFSRQGTEISAAEIKIVKNKPFYIAPCSRCYGHKTFSHVVWDNGHGRLNWCFKCSGTGLGKLAPCYTTEQLEKMNIRKEASAVKRIAKKKEKADTIRTEFLATNASLIEKMQEVASNDVRILDMLRYFEKHGRLSDKQVAFARQLVDFKSGLERKKEAFLAEHGGLFDRLNVMGFNNSFCQSLISWFNRHGSLSEKQIEAAKKVVADADKPKKKRGCCVKCDRKLIENRYCGACDV